MLPFAFIEEGELTKKQRQKEDTIRCIMTALNNHVDMTWTELIEASQLSKSILHKHLIEMIKQGVVKGTVKVKKDKNDKNDRLKTVYEYTGKAFKITGKPRKVEAAVRIVHTKKNVRPHEIKEVRNGKLISKRVKGRRVKTYFIED